MKNFVGFLTARLTFGQALSCILLKNIHQSFLKPVFILSQVLKWFGPPHCGNERKIFSKFGRLPPPLYAPVFLPKAALWAATTNVPKRAPHLLGCRRSSSLATIPPNNPRSRGTRPPLLHGYLGYGKRRVHPHLRACRAGAFRRSRLTLPA